MTAPQSTGNSKSSKQKADSKTGSNSQAEASTTSTGNAKAATAASSVNPFEKMKITDKTFVPPSHKNNPSAVAPSEDGMSNNSASAANDRRVEHSDSVGYDDFGGYQNPFTATVDVEKEKRKQ